MTRQRLSCRDSVLIGLAIVIASAHGPALAQEDTAALSKLCEAAAVDPDEGIPACTRLLEPGRARINIAAVYAMRGAGWSSKQLYDSAIGDFNEAIQRDPKNIGAFANRGIAWWSKGEFDRAIADFSATVSINPKFAFGYMARGTALSDKGEFDLAIRDFDKTIALDPSSADAYKRRGGARYRKGDLDRAIADFNQFVRLSPTNPDSFNDRAQVAVARGDFVKAFADYDQAIKLQPGFWRGYSSRGEAFRVKGDYDKAIADHDEAIRLDPKQMDAYNNRGLTWMAKGDVDRAIADFGEAILLNPGYGYSYSNRGEAYRLKGDLTKSLADLDKAIELTPRASLHFCRRGDTLRHSGDFDRALKDYNEALRLSPIAICAFTGKGMIAEAKGELTTAKAEFQRAIDTEAWRDQDPTTARETQGLAKTRLAAIVTAEVEQAKKLAAAQQAEKLAIAKANEPPPIDPGRRVALVIGNSAYFNTEVLPNPRRDAESIADAFRRIGFQSVSLQKDLTREKLTNALKDFSRVASGADWAVIYYAGHGIEVDGKNYMIPIDAKLAIDTDVTFEGVALDQVMTSVNQAKKLRLVMLDACRDNPFAKTMTRSTGDVTRGAANRGLAAIEPDGATLVVYAAKAGQLALDGSGRGNSPFVSAFLRNLEKPRIEIRKLFDLVRDDVMEATSNRQQPFTYGSVPGREDYFMVTK
jgi:tetratricopeptide (TPR) repeat protein